MFSFNHRDQEGVLIAYRMDPKKVGQKGINRICRKLYGYTDYSNNKQYTYHRQGLLDRVPHIHLNPIRSVLILHKEDAAEAIKILAQEGAEIYAKDVKLAEEDLQDMERSLATRNKDKDKGLEKEKGHRDGEKQ